MITVTITGNLADDPHTFHTSDGRAGCDLRLAVDLRPRGATGEGQFRTSPKEPHVRKTGLAGDARQDGPLGLRCRADGAAGVALGAADGPAGGDGVEPQRRGDLGDRDADLPARLARLGDPGLRGRAARGPGTACPSGRSRISRVPAPGR